MSSTIDYCYPAGGQHSWIIDSRTNQYVCENRGCGMRLNQIPGAPARTPIKPKASKSCMSQSTASLVHWWYTDENDGRQYCENCGERR